MAADNSGLFFALMLYCFIQSLRITKCPNFTVRNAVIVKESWGYLLGNVSTQKISFGHGQLYNTLISPSFVHARRNGYIETGNRHYRMSTKTIVTRKTARLENLLFTYSLLLCGDIHPCPGPTVSRAPRYPCLICAKDVRTNSKAVACESCDKWTHIKCCDIDAVLTVATFLLYATVVHLRQ